MYLSLSLSLSLTLSFLSLPPSLSHFADPVEAKFLSGVFSPLTSAEACEKSSRWLWKEICVSTGVRKPGNTCASPTLAVKVALNPNTTNQPTLSFSKPRIIS